MKHLLAPLALSIACASLGACAPSASSAKTPLAPGWSQETSRGDCTRRAEAMAEQSEAMRAGPHELTNAVNQGHKGTWQSANNPCGRDPGEASVRAQEDRDLAKVRARSFWEQEDLEAAKEALSSAYFDSAPEDEDLDQLTRDVAVSWERAAARTGDRPTGQTCLLTLPTDEPSQPSRVVTLWPQGRPIVSRCPIPATFKSAHPEAKLYVILRRRTATGKFDLVRRVELSQTKSAAQSSLIDAQLEAPTLEELGGNNRAYVDISLVSFREGVPQRVVSRAGIFVLPPAP